MRKSNPTILCILCLLSLVCSFYANPAFAQGARIRAQKADRDAPAQQTEVEQDSDRDNPTAREEWFRSGRHALGEHSADLLHRAYQQKRAIAAAEQAAKDSTATSVQQSTANGAADTANP